MALPLAARDISIVLILISGLLTGAVCQDVACNKTRRANDLAGCLSGIRQIAGNSSYFWFGSVYAAKCPSYRNFAINCYNPHQGVKTLAGLVFGVDHADLSSIDRYVDVKYSSGPGSYVGCDYVFTQNTTIEFTVDPLSATAYPTWDLRAQPQVTWTADQTDLFTLIVVDAGYGWLHGLYVNIPGDMVNQSEAVKAYHGPRNTRDVPNVYAFVLYKQPSSISTNSIFLPPFTAFNVTKAADDYKFGELVGLSWVLASYDAYAMELQAPFGIIQNCADLVSKAYQSHPHRPFLPDTLDLSVYLRLQISQDATMYPCGRERKSLPAVDFFVNPIGMPIINTANARTETTRTFSMQMNKYFPNNTVDFNGKMYSLMTVDADIPSDLSYAGSNDLPLLHGLIINIQGDDVTTGSVLKSYIGPGPPDPQRHIYYFLLYEQQSTLQLTNTSAYADQGRCQSIPELHDRCQFNVTSFVSTNSLKLVGATWLAAVNDEYVVCRNKPVEDVMPPISGASSTVASVLVCLYTVTLWTLQGFLKST